MCICMNYGNDVNEFLYFKSDQEQYPLPSLVHTQNL